MRSGIIPTTCAVLLQLTAACGSSETDPGQATAVEVGGEAGGSTDADGTDTDRESVEDPSAETEDTQGDSDTTSSGSTSDLEASEDSVEPVSDGVITDITATATGGGGNFDGFVDRPADLTALVETAWGVERLGLHRGHGPIENVLVAFLGISHEQMHAYMENQGMNLAAVARELGKDPEDLVDTLTYSFRPYVEEGVENGIITEDEVAGWVEQVREQFSNRVYWEG